MRIGWPLLLALLLAACATPVPGPVPTATLSLPTAAPTSAPGDPTRIPNRGDDASPATPNPTPTYNPSVGSTASAGDVLFLRPLDPAVWVLGMRSVELWAAAPDGSTERLITTYSPLSSRTPGGALSPDGRLLAVPDLDGVTLIDVQAGEKTRIDSGLNGVSALTWAGEALFYSATLANPAGGLGIVRELRRYVPFAAEPETLASDQRIAVSLPGGGTQEVGLFPAQGLPDGTLLMAARDSAFAYGLSVIYEPESGGLFRVTRADTGEPVRVVDVQNGEALFLPEDVGAQAPLFRGQLDPAGRLEAVEQVASAGAVPDRAAMLPDAVVASVRGALVRITPDERTLLLEGVDSGFAVLGPETIIVPVPEGETVVLVTLSVDGGEPALLAEGNYPLVVP